MGSNHPNRVAAAIPLARQRVLVVERRMKVALVLVVGMVVLIALVAAAELLRMAASRLLGPRRRGRGRSSPDVWGAARDARRDAEVLQSRPDIGTSWTSWERRGRRGR
jgi:hypothetical protein